MLSYAHGTAAYPLLAETIGADLEASVARSPDALALVSVHQDLRFSYAEFNAAVDALAGGMLGAGLERGDRVGIWSPNRAEWAIVQYATAKLGLILVNINPSCRTHELSYALAQSGARWLFAASEYRGSDFTAMVDAVRPELPDLERVVFFGQPAWGELAVAEPKAGNGAIHDRMASLDADDPINLQYTSGTTGSPKGATLSHHNILNNGQLIARILGYSSADRVCIPVPLYHCFGMVMGNLAATHSGAAIVYPSAVFDPEATLAAVAKERCTSLYGVPTMFIAELDQLGEHDLSSLRTGIMAGSPCPIEIMRRVVADMGIAEMSICFGMTETSPVTTMVRPDETLEHRCETVGQAMPHTEIKIADPDSGRTLERGETGEFCARGYPVMRGYWRDPERTAEVLDETGWMHTGDLATMDQDGYVRIVGRIKDMIIRGGENVYPREIEEFLYGHPAIADVQVIGVPDERYGEAVMAWIVPRAPLDEDEVREYCRASLAHFKCPKYVKFVDEFPMTVTGKIQKYKMREDAIADLGLAPA